MPLAAFALRTHCWLIFSLLSTTTPRAFSAELLPSQSILVSPILCHWKLLFLPRQRTCRFSLLWSCHTSSQPVCHPTYRGAPCIQSAPSFPKRLSIRCYSALEGLSFCHNCALPSANAHQELPSPAQCSALTSPEGEHWRNVLQLKN